MQKKNEIHLTPRQKEVLILSSEGKTYRQIAQRLGISYGTVRAHLVMVREKLDVRNTTTAVYMVRDHLLGS